MLQARGYKPYIIKNAWEKVTFWSPQIWRSQNHHKRRRKSKIKATLISLEDTEIFVIN